MQNKVLKNMYKKKACKTRGLNYEIVINRQKKIEYNHKTMFYI